KRKIENNVLIIWCLPNKAKSNLQLIDNRITASNTSKNQNNPFQNTNCLKLLTKEYSLITNSLPQLNPQIIAWPLFANYIENCFSVFSPLQSKKPPKFIQYYQLHC
ncbi:MAG: hypothetical protein ACOVNR_10270, partial [Chitinophagaceae bacterium]